MEGKKAMKKKFIKNLILHNMGWKLLSIFLAMFLWFIVMNLINPTEIKTYVVDISFTNKDKLEASEFVILNEDEIKQKKIEIKVKGTRTALDELSKKENKKNIKAVVDLSQFELLYAQNIEESVKIGVTPSIPANLYSYTYQIMSYTPSFIEIKLDNVSKKSFPVTVEVVGSAADGYVTSSIQTVPENITLTGAESELEKVSQVKVYLDITGITSSIEKDLAPVILDDKEKPINSLKSEDKTVKASVLVNKQGHIEIKQPESSGTPAESYYVDSIDYEPKSIEVVGDENGISNISSIELPEINVEGISEDKTIVFDIRPYLKNTGLSLKDDSNNEVYVSVKLKADLKKNISISPDKISLKGLGNNLSAFIENGAEISLTGKEEVLNELNADSLNPEVNLNSLEEGSHNVELILSVPDGIKIDKKYYVNVIIKNDSENNENNENNESHEISASEENSDDKENSENESNSSDETEDVS